MASLFTAPQYDGGNGIQPEDGLQLFFFEEGTSTPKDTFTTEALDIANSNPVISDANGVFPEIWMTEGDRYKAQLKNKNDVQVGFGIVDPYIAVLSTVDFAVSPSNVAELSLISPQIGDTASTKGYYIAGDGGKADYLAVAKFSEDDFGDHISANPLVSWELQDAISINNYGATSTRTAEQNTLSMQAAIDKARVIQESIITNKIVIVKSSVHARSGIYDHNELNTFNGLRFYGDGISNTLLKFKGATGNAFNIVKAAPSEELFGVQFEDLFLFNDSGAGTPRGISGDDGEALAIRKCHLKSVAIYGFNINLFLDNSFTFQIDNCSITNGIKNNAVLNNATSSGANWTRFDVAGESCVIVDDGSTGQESVVCTFQKCTFQSAGHWGLLGIDVLTMRVIDCFFEANNQIVGDYGSLYLSDGPNTRGKHYELRGNFFSPGSGESGQTAIKVDRAEILETSNMIRGSNINIGMEIGDNVEIVIDSSSYTNQTTNIQYNEATTKVLSHKSTLGLPSFFGEGVTNSSFAAADANLLAGQETGGHALIGAFDGMGGIQGAGSGSNFLLELNPVDGYTQMGARIQRRSITGSSVVPTKAKPMLVATRTSGGQNFDLSNESAGDFGEFSIYKLNENNTVAVVPASGDSVNGGVAGATFQIVSGAASDGYYMIIGVANNDWRVVKMPQA